MYAVRKGNEGVEDGPDCADMEGQGMCMAQENTGA